jgi:hypothetical protein
MAFSSKTRGEKMPESPSGDVHVTVTILPDEYLIEIKDRLGLRNHTRKSCEHLAGLVTRNSTAQIWCFDRAPFRSRLNSRNQA